MFLDNAFQHCRRARVIPRALWINNSNGALCANAQAIDLRAIDQRFRPDEIKFLKSRLQKFPRGEGLFARAAFGFVRVHAEEDVAAKFFEAERFDGGLEFGLHRDAVQI